MTTEQVTGERVPRRALVARAAAAIAMGVGVFGVTLAWCGAVGQMPGDPTIVRAWVGPSWLQGDGGVAAAGAAAIGLPWLSARARSTRGAAATALIASTSLGGALGFVVLNGLGGWANAALNAWGAGLWLGLSLLRAACALPLAFALRRGAPLASRDALDRVMLGAAAWLLAALAEAALVVRLARPMYSGFAGPALGVGLLSLTLLAGLAALGALARSARWFGLWRRVTRGVGWRLVAPSAWAGAAPPDAWFEGLGASEAVAVRTVAREGMAYREGDLEVALGRVPSDVARVRRGLLLRALAAVALLAAHVGAVAALVAPLRW